MSWEAIWNGAYETVSENAGKLFDSAVDIYTQQEREKAKDPEVLKAIEPVKGTRADGSTIVGATPTSAQPTVQGQWVGGVDNTVILVGGGIFVTLLVVLLRGR
jgi:hypothetical protein